MRLPLRVLADSTGWILTSWLVVPGSKVYRNQRVAALHSTSTGAMDHALAPREGTLRRIFVSEGSHVNNVEGAVPDFEAAIAEIEFCPHSVVYQGLCGVCGEEAVVSHFANVKEGVTRLPVPYNAQTLSVTRAEAESVAHVTAQQLLRERRLLLVLDLDHTLVHATDDPRASAVLGYSPSGCDVSSVASFSLAPSDNVVAHSGPLNTRMHLKLRPHLREFLSRCSALFELHIYTMGSRPYADRVAELIDPDKRLFSGRITSREDFEEGRSNQKNISRLFPCDDSMVLIIDDREDVWVSGTGASFMPNLIRAKPYTFFNGLHEAYDRALSSGTTTKVGFSALNNAAVSELCPTRGMESKRGLIADESEAGTNSAIATLPHVSKLCEHGTVECESEPSSAGPNTATGRDSIVENVSTQMPPVAKGRDESIMEIVERDFAEPRSESALELMPVLSEELRKLVRQWWENDSSSLGWNSHLLRLASVLEMCHRKFFVDVPVVALNEAPVCPLQIPADVKAIVSDIRRGILEGCVLTFTGVFPRTTAPEETDVWELATRHGALCHNEFILGMTTHVIASVERGLSTEKATAAIESGAAFIVNMSWLEDSTIQFERRPELMYSLLATKRSEGCEEFRARVNAEFARASERRQKNMVLHCTPASANPTHYREVAGVANGEHSGILESRPCPAPGGEERNRCSQKRRDENAEQRVLDADEADLAFDEAFQF